MARAEAVNSQRPAMEHGAQIEACSEDREDQEEAVSQPGSTAKTHKQGWGVMVFAAARSVPSLVRKVIGPGADGDITSSGMTALHICAATSDADIAAKRGEGLVVANMLLNAGANPFQENREGRTPIDMTIELGSTKLRRLMEDRALFTGEFMFTMKGMSNKQRQHICTVYPRFPLASLELEHDFVPLYLHGYKDLKHREPSFRLPLEGATLNVSRKDAVGTLTLAPGVSMPPTKLACMGSVKRGVAIEIRPAEGDSSELLHALAFIIHETGGHTTLAATLADLSTLAAEKASGGTSPSRTPALPLSVHGNNPSMERSSMASSLDSANSGTTDGEPEHYISFGQLFPDNLSTGDSQMDNCDTWADISFVPDVQLPSKARRGAKDSAPAPAHAAVHGQKARIRHRGTETAERQNTGSPMSTAFSRGHGNALPDHSCAATTGRHKDPPPEDYSQSTITGGKRVSPADVGASDCKRAEQLVELALQGHGSPLSTRGSLIPATISRLSLQRSSTSPSSKDHLQEASTVELKHLQPCGAVQQSNSELSQSFSDTDSGRSTVPHQQLINGTSRQQQAKRGEDSRQERALATLYNNSGSRGAGHKGQEKLPFWQERQVATKQSSDRLPVGKSKTSIQTSFVRPNSKHPRMSVGADEGQQVPSLVASKAAEPWQRAGRHVPRRSQHKTVTKANARECLLTPGGHKDLTKRALQLDDREELERWGFSVTGLPAEPADSSPNTDHAKHRHWRSVSGGPPTSDCQESRSQASSQHLGIGSEQEQMRREEKALAALRATSQPLSS